MRWFLSNMQVLLPVLLVIISAVSRVLKSLAEQKQQADLQRTGQRPGTPGQPSSPILQHSEVLTQNRSPAMTQGDLAAQRQAQIEMWKARQAALGSPMQSSSAGPSAEDELARRRRMAMEELRRRQAAEDLRRSTQSTQRVQPAPVGPTTRRQRAQVEAQRRVQAAQRRSSIAPVEAPVLQAARSSIIGDVVAATAAHPHPEPRAIPASRTSPAGSILLNPESLRQAFIMKELLDPPLALRDNSAGFGAGYDQAI